MRIERRHLKLLGMTAGAVLITRAALAYLAPWGLYLLGMLVLIVGSILGLRPWNLRIRLLGVACFTLGLYLIFSSISQFDFSFEVVWTEGQG